MKVGAWIGAATGVALAVVLMGDSDDAECPSAECPNEAEPAP